MEIQRHGSPPHGQGNYATWHKKYSWYHSRRCQPQVSPIGLASFQSKVTSTPKKDDQLAITDKDIFEPPPRSSGYIVPSTTVHSTRYHNHKNVKEFYNEQNGRKTIHIEIHETSSWSRTDEEVSQKEPEVEEEPEEEEEEIKIEKVKGKAKKANRELTLREVLLDRALNVDHLSIGEHQKIQIHEDDHLYLPALKVFTWHAYDPQTGDEKLSQKKIKQIQKNKRHAVLKILTAAPNLKLLKDFNFPTDWDIVTATGKVQTVQHLIIYDTVNVDHLLDFIGAKPHVKILQLIDTYTDDPFSPSLIPDPEEQRRRLALAIKKLLLSTHKTLLVLDLTQFCSRVHDIEIPHKLSKLEQLTLGSVNPGNSVWKPQPSRVLPGHIRLDKTFPHLKVLDLGRLEMGENSNWPLYFPPTAEFQGSLDSVKVLVIDDQTTLAWMQRIKERLVPNFSKLVIHSGHRPVGEMGSSLNFMLLKIFQNWQHLQHLELRISNLISNSAAFCLDSTFTGYTFETCRRLRVFGPAADPDDDVMLSMALVGKNAHLEECHCPRPSIKHLKHLKSLNIILGHDALEKLARYDQDEDNPMPLMSFVSGRYGFIQLKGLKVNIIFDQLCPWGNGILKKKFDYLSPYITLKHIDDDQCDRDHDHDKVEEEKNEIIRLTNI